MQKEDHQCLSWHRPEVPETKVSNCNWLELSDHWHCYQLLTQCI